MAVLFHHLFRYSPERSLCRNLTCDNIFVILVKFSDDSRKSAFTNITDGCRSTKVKVRLICVELIKRILSDKENNFSTGGNELLSALCKMTRDNSATVQYRTLLALTEILEGCVIDPNADIMAPGLLQPSLIEVSEMDTSRSSQISKKTNPDCIGRLSLADYTMYSEDGSKIIKSFVDGDNILKEMMNSKNPQTRKYICSLVKALIVRSIIPADDVYLNVLTLGTQDLLQSVRKHSVLVYTKLIVDLDKMSITSSLSTSINEVSKQNIIKTWLMAILMNVNDPEISVREAATNSLENYLISPLIEHANNEIWDSVDLLEPDHLNLFHEKLIDLLKFMKSRDKFNNLQLRALIKNTFHQLEMSDGNQIAAWIVIDAISKAFQDHDINELIIAAFNKYFTEMESNETKKFAIRAIANVLPKLDEDDKGDLIFR